MADPSGSEPTPPGLPPWVKVSGIIVVVLAGVGVILALILGGDHGPGRHLPGGDPPPTIEQPRNHTPPVGDG